MGATTQPSELKYLWVILDKKHLWNKNFGAKVKRTFTAYRLCKRTFVSQGDLGLIQQCVAIITSMFAYAFVVWWIKVKHKSFHHKLASLQRTEYLGITNAMSTTKLLNSQSLDVHSQWFKGIIGERVVHVLNNSQFFFQNTYAFFRQWQSQIKNNPSQTNYRANASKTGFPCIGVFQFTFIIASKCPVIEYMIFEKKFQKKYYSTPPQ